LGGTGSIACGRKTPHVNLRRKWDVGHKVIS
jgi:hypothetical protein